MRTITLLSLLFISIYGKGQEQVSDVYFDELQTPFFVNGICGFHAYNGVDYVTIENDSLQIYELDNGELSLKHIIYKPNEFETRAFGNVYYNSSQKNIDGKYYYSFYKNGIYIADIEDGSIYQSIDVSEYGYSLSKALKRTDDQIYFYGKDEESYATYFRYDIANNEIFQIDAPIETNYYVRIIDHTIFYIEDSLSRIMGYDLLKDSTFIVHQYNGELISNLQWRSNLGQDYLTFRDENGFKIIKEDLEISELNCNFENLSEVSLLELKGDKAILGVKEMDLISLQVYNIDNCELIQKINVDNSASSSATNFSINDHLVGDYSLVRYESSDFLGGKWKIVIDHTSNTNSFRVNTGSVMPNSAKETMNAIYWNEYKSYSFGIEILRYDKLTGAVAKISPYDNRVISSSLGISKDDEFYFAANDENNDYKIWKTLDGVQFNGVKDLDFRYNLGVQTRYDIRVDNESVVSNGVGGLMVTEDNTDVISSGVYKRDIAVTENYIATVITEDESNFVFKYNKQTGATSKILLNQVEQYQFEPEITDKFIFNLEPYTLRYFDIESEEFRSLNHNSPSINMEPSKYYLSRDEMVITEWTGSNSPQNYFMFDFETETLSKIDHELPKSFSWAITDDNIFYFDDTKVFLVEEEITRIKDGAAPEIVYSGDCSQINLSSSPKLQTGAYAELFFRCEGELLIVADDGTSTYSTSFPTDASLFSGNIENVILHSNKDEYLLKSETGDQEKLFLYTAPNSLIELNVPEAETYVTTSFDLDRPLLITLNEEEKSHNFYLLDKLTGDLELKMQTTYGSDFVPSFFSNPHAVSNTQYVASVWTNSLGSELFEIDLENQVFELKVDFFEGTESSFPGNFTRTSEYLYFIAGLEKDGKQWFRINTDLLSSNHEIAVESIQDLNVFPNPSSISINTSIILENYSVYNSHGQEVISNSSNHSASVDISELQNGHYIISGFGKNGLVYSSGFVKIE